jgi:hypothetical protein
MVTELFELTDRFVPRSRDVASEDFDGEFVVLDLKSGKYFSLLDGSAIVWKGLMSGHSATTLCARLPADDPRRNAVASLLTSLMDHGLIVVATAPVADPADDLAAILAASTGGFEVEMFDDLADLLVADPVHDVDEETGWPAMPPGKTEA